VCPAVETGPLEVCPDEKDSVTLCAECGVKPAIRKFCSNACRQAAYRKSPAHAACLRRDKDWRKARRRAWRRERLRFCAINPLVQFSGPSNDVVPRLGDFWISPEGKRLNLPQKEKSDEF
jgi:hypothetical protein